MTWPGLRRRLFSLGIGGAFIDRSLISRPSKKYRFAFCSDRLSRTAKSLTASFSIRAKSARSVMYLQSFNEIRPAFLAGSCQGVSLR